MSSKDNILKLEKIIKEHPLFEVENFIINEKVDAASLIAFKEQYGMDAPPELTNLYQEMNGFTLTYKLKNDSDEVLQAFMQASSFRPDRTPIGAINFLKFEKAFLSDTWKGILYETNSLSDSDELWFNGQSYTYDGLGKKIKPFDTYSDATCAALLLTDQTPFDVILLQDHYADWKNSRRISFESYFKFILLTGGLIQARSHYLSEIDGDEEPRFEVTSPKSLLLPFFKEMGDLFLES